MKQGWLVPVAALALLAGCSAMPGHAGHGASRTDYCAEYRATMAGKSVEEQRKASEAHIVRMHGTADAAHVERHMKMMEQRCANATGQPGG
jgi:hypothetical protein